MKKRVKMLCGLLIGLMVWNNVAITSKAERSNVYNLIHNTGKCGDNVTFDFKKIHDSGRFHCRLEISGTGDMYDYEVGSSIPWSLDSSTYMTPNVVSYADIYINEGVTRIGSGSMHTTINTELRLHPFPNSLKTIGEKAFKGDWSESIEIGGGVEIIEDEAFSSPLFRVSQSLVIGDNVKHIGKRAFYKCGDRNSTIKLGNGLISIGDEAFAQVYANGEVTFSEGIETIGKQAFVGCNNLVVDMHFPKSLTYLGLNAFYLCKMKQDYAVFDNPNTEIVGKLPIKTIYAFSGGAVEDYAHKNGYTFVSTGVYIRDDIQNDETDDVTIKQDSVAIVVIDKSTGKMIKDNIYPKNAKLRIWIDGKSYDVNANGVLYWDKADGKSHSVYPVVSTTAGDYIAIDRDTPRVLTKGELVKLYVQSSTIIPDTTSNKTEYSTGRIIQVDGDSFVTDDGTIHQVDNQDLLDKIKDLNSSNVQIVEEDGVVTKVIDLRPTYLSKEAALEKTMMAYENATESYLAEVKNQASKPNKQKDSPEQIIRSLEKDHGLSVLVLNDNISKAQRAAVYEAYYNYLKRGIRIGQQMGSINLNNSEQKIEIGIARKIASNLCNEKFSWTSGGYKVVFGTNGIDLYGGNARFVTVSVNGKLVGGVATREDVVADALYSFMNELHGMTADFTTQVLESMVTDLIKATSISEINKDIINKFFKGKEALLEEKGFGDLANVMRSMRSAYDILADIKKDINDDDIVKSLKSSKKLISEFEKIEYPWENEPTYKELKKKYNTLKSTKHDLDKAFVECLADDKAMSSFVDKAKTVLYKRVALVNCPVDVEIYDSKGKKIAYTDNNTPYDCDNVAIEVHGDQKVITILHDGSDYSVKLIPTGYGTMDYSILEYAGNTVVGRLNYYNVPLDGVSSYTQDLDNSWVENDLSQFPLVTNGISLNADEYISGTASEKIRITCSTDGKGTATGSGTYEKGNAVKLTATSKEGYTFDGWYLNGELVYADAIYRFTAKENATYTAKFVVKEPEKTYDPEAQSSDDEKNSGQNDKTPSDNDNQNGKTPSDNDNQSDKTPSDNNNKQPDNHEADDQNKDTSDQGNIDKSDNTKDPSGTDNGSSNNSGEDAAGDTGNKDDTSGAEPDSPSSDSLIDEGDGGNVDNGDSDSGEITNGDETITVSSFSSNGIRYSVLSGSSNQVSILSYNGTNGKLKISGKVAYQGVSYRIAAVGDGAFENNNTVKKLSLSSSIKRIGDRAFANTKMKKIQLNADNLTSIGTGAFEGLKNNAVITIIASSKQKASQAEQMIRNAGGKGLKIKHKIKDSSGSSSSGNSNNVTIGDDDGISITITGDNNTVIIKNH